MAYAFDPAPIPAIPVAGSSLMFPVHRIYCVGRNYAEHAREIRNCLCGNPIAQIWRPNG